MIEILVYSGTTREQSPIEKGALRETGNALKWSIPKRLDQSILFCIVKLNFPVPASGNR